MAGAGGHAGVRLSVHVEEASKVPDEGLETAHSDQAVVGQVEAKDLCGKIMEGVG